MPSFKSLAVIALVTVATVFAINKFTKSGVSGLGKTTPTA